MIKIVTIEREYGSGGGEIAQLLATQLGWKLWDQLLTEEIARLANCSKAVVEVREERTDPLYYRLFKSFLRGSYEGSLNAHKLNVVDSESILKITERSFSTPRRRETPSSSEGDRSIFSGTARTRCACFFTLPEKIKCGACWLAARVEKEAEQLVDTVDRERADFIQKYFHVEWPDRAIYHAMINTAIGDEAVVHMILDFMKTVDARVAD